MKKKARFLNCFAGITFKSILLALKRVSFPKNTNIFLQVDFAGPEESLFSQKYKHFPERPCDITPKKAIVFCEQYD